MLKDSRFEDSRIADRGFEDRGSRTRGPRIEDSRIEGRGFETSRLEVDDDVLLEAPGALLEAPRPDAARGGWLGRTLGGSPGIDLERVSGAGEGPMVPRFEVLAGLGRFWASWGALVATAGFLLEVLALTHPRIDPGVDFGPPGTQTSSHLEKTPQIFAMFGPLGPSAGFFFHQNDEDTPIQKHRGSPQQGCATTCD